VLEEQRALLPKLIQDSLVELVDASHDLRGDLELAFYGGENITLLQFYKKTRRVCPGKSNQSSQDL